MSNKDNLLSFVSLIKNSEIRDFTTEMLGVLPDVYWTAKASKGHHPEDERGSEGNIIHSERVTKLVRIIAECTELNSNEVDCITSAAILHDGCRYDMDGQAEYTVPDHPFQIRELAGLHSIDCTFAGHIFILIERHTGRWGDPIYWPEITPSTILHIADVISAHAEQVWPIGDIIKPEWVGSTPFQEIGMDVEKLDLMKELAVDNAYWKSSLGFFKQVASRKLSSLTDKQRTWLFSIEASLSDELNKRGAEDTMSEGSLSDEVEDLPF